MTCYNSNTPGSPVEALQGSDQEKKQWVRDYMGLVRSAVKRFRFQHARNEQVLEERDLVQFGLLGLLDAASRFKPSKGVKFETFAISRIRGAILDELRKLDWIPRSVRKKRQKAERLSDALENSTNRLTTAQHVAASLSMTLEEYNTLLNEGCLLPADGRLLYDDERDVVENLAADDSTDPYEIMCAEETREQLIEAVESLPARDRLVITLYYFEGMTFREIGAVLKVTESRVCQIQKAVLRDLRARLTKWENIP